MPEVKQVNLTVLRELILEQFDREELRTLAFDMVVEYDDLRGEGRSAKARELVDYLQRRQQIEELIAYCRQHRPNGNWDAVYEESVSLPPVPGLQLPNWVWAVSGLAIILAATLIILLRSKPGEGETPNVTPQPTLSTTNTTPTAATPRPIPVALNPTNCDEETAADLTAEIEAAGGIIENDAALLSLAVTCNNDQLELHVQMPARPAYRLEFLDEPQNLSLTAESVYGRSFIGAILHYSSGNYHQAIEKLTQSENFLNASHAYLLHGHARMHLGQWPEARLRYEKALEVSGETADQARLYASTGTAYILEHIENINTFSTCVEMAEPLFDQAITLDPDRAFWWAGRAWARAKCPQSQDPTIGIRTDIQEALNRAPDQSIDQAHALFLDAFYLLLITDEVDKLKAESDIEQALQFSPELVPLYQLSSCLHFLNSDGETAARLYQEYINRLTFDWQITKAQLRKSNQDFCN